MARIYAESMSTDDNENGNSNLFVETAKVMELFNFIIQTSLSVLGKNVFKLSKSQINVNDASVFGHVFLFSFVFGQSLLLELSCGAIGSVFNALGLRLVP